MQSYTVFHSCYLDVEDSHDASVLPLPRQPTLTQEEEDLLRVHVNHLHLVQVPVSARHAVVMADFYLEYLSKVNCLNSKFIHLRRGNSRWNSMHIIKLFVFMFTENDSLCQAW